MKIHSWAPKSSSSTSLKLAEADNIIEFLEEIISNISPLKISFVIRETMESRSQHGQDIDNAICSMKNKKKKLESIKKNKDEETRKRRKEKKQRREDEKFIENIIELQKESGKKKIKIKTINNQEQNEDEDELIWIPREEYEKEALAKRRCRSPPACSKNIQDRRHPLLRDIDIINKHVKLKEYTYQNENSLYFSPIKEPSIGNSTIPISDDDDDDCEDKPIKKVKISSPNIELSTDSKEQVSIDMQKEFGNTLSELGERLQNLTTLGNSMKTWSFLQEKNREFVSMEKESQHQEQHEPLEILNDFYSKVKGLFVEFSENLNQSKVK